MVYDKLTDNIGIDISLQRGHSLEATDLHMSEDKEMIEDERLEEMAQSRISFSTHNSAYDEPYSSFPNTMSKNQMKTNCIEKVKSTIGMEEVDVIPVSTVSPLYNPPTISPKQATSLDLDQKNFFDIPRIPVNFMVEHSSASNKSSRMQNIAAKSTLKAGGANPDSVAPLLLLSLPLDPLHCIAGFVAPKDWSHFSLASKAANRICIEIFHRVRMHGFRCATEVIASWKRGQHADAKELCAMYIQSGVPIYPQCLGHAYHTLLWRMQLQVTEMETSPEKNNGGNSIGTNDTNRSTMHSFNNETDFSARSRSIGDDSNKPSHIKIVVDRFYTERIDARNTEGYYIPTLTYLEEKCLYWRSRQASCTDNPSSWISLEQRHNLEAGVNLRPPAPPIPGMPTQDHGRMDRQILTSTMLDNRLEPSHLNVADGIPLPMEQSTKIRSTVSIHQPHFRNMPVSIHRHLLNRHTMHRPAVNDDDGNMKAAPISLSADFFFPPNYFVNRQGCANPYSMAHPSDYSRINSSTYGDTSDHHLNLAGRLGGDGTDDSILQGSIARAHDSSLIEQSNLGIALEQIPRGDGVKSGENGTELLPNINLVPLTQDERRHILSSNENIANPSYSTNSETHGSLIPPILPPSPTTNTNYFIRSDAFDQLGTSPDTYLQHMSGNGFTNLPEEHSVIKDVTLNMYSSCTEDNFSSEDDAIVTPTIESEKRLFYSNKMLRAAHERFTFYQRRLDVMLLSRSHSAAFDDIIFELWDEFFPLSASVHFYDQHTPVPRMSCLNHFLTKPLPKAWGTVQCEIERIKVSNTKRGAGMKGRLFPSYEYRLFIKDRRMSLFENLSTATTGLPPRMDTILVTAKNKGKNHLATTGTNQSLSKSKRGVNNYYLSMPHQEDLDQHFEAVNEILVEPRVSSQTMPTTNHVELGRLQSNFIGTEFQIFSPCLAKHSTRKSSVQAYRSSSTAVLGRSCCIEQSLQNHCSSTKREKKLRKTFSTLYGRSSSRKSRRAIANLTKISGQDNYSIMGEEEIGAITYTANLLGNRPRIMDVCIPKVISDSSVSNEWRKYCEQSYEGGENVASMLSKLKVLQFQSVNRNHDEIDSEPLETACSTDFGLQALQNRSPWWNVELGAFVLNFGGRVNVASVKNFQLCDLNDHENIMLQFGRILGRHSFTMDYSHPLTAVQAFAIAISSLQSKISFG